MHEVDFADVVGKKPVVLLFATPLLCQSRVCGPVVDIAEEVMSERGKDADFIHMEIFEDNTVDKGYRPQVRDFGLPSEPWAFTIDRNGKVAARLEGAFSARELNAAIDKAVKKPRAPLAPDSDQVHGAVVDRRPVLAALAAHSRHHQPVARAHLAAPRHPPEREAPGGAHPRRSDPEGVLRGAQRDPHLAAAELDHRPAGAAHGERLAEGHHRRRGDYPLLGLRHSREGRREYQNAGACQPAHGADRIAIRF